MCVHSELALSPPAKVFIIRVYGRRKSVLLVLIIVPVVFVLLAWVTDIKLLQFEWLVQECALVRCRDLPPVTIILDILAGNLNWEFALYFAVVVLLLSRLIFDC